MPFDAEVRTIFGASRTESREEESSSDVLCGPLMQGDLIAPDGTMTGGGGKPRSGRMRLGVNPPSGAALGASSPGGSGADGEEAATLEGSLSQLQQVRQLAGGMFTFVV